MCGPWCPFFPAFLACSVSCFALLILALSSACSLSVPLCLGISRSINSRHRSSSSGDCARRYSSSAFLYCGVRLAGIALPGPLFPALIELAAEGLVVAGPGAVAAGVFLEELSDAVELGVEVVEQVQSDRLERHRQLRAAELIFAVVADDQVLEM